METDNWLQVTETRTKSRKPAVPAKTKTSAFKTTCISTKSWLVLIWTAQVLLINDK
jgi:hypothetical protein